MKVKQWLLPALLLLCTPLAHANLLVNGDFEDPVVDEGKWQWFAGEDVDGWDGASIEIWHMANGTIAFSGLQHAELNAAGPTDGAWMMSQTFASDIGSFYEVGFAYSARFDDEVFLFEVLAGDDIVFSQSFDDHTFGTWSEFSVVIEALAADTSVRFTSVNPETGYSGNFLDGVYAIESDDPSQAIPEPKSVAIFAVALIAIVALRRYRRKLEQ
ncbi:hypothetical protein FE810_08615 [Thalassotalea litorea]|uniref:PEP-CTERM sorting domain-containing protein n=1 Tax=Thalassotalea litorea TaxID=2020715 RepID=A0A5R9ITS6_9GAMM|nr:hypothetical protein [Thalassotalea litorea]TLU65338.1 hypothetical protein FE810_08615 [Thalassotalea litorea]